jgi:hypothetical protein
MNQRQAMTRELVARIGWRLYMAVIRFNGAIIHKSAALALIRSVKRRKEYPVDDAVKDVMVLSEWLHIIRERRRRSHPSPMKHPGERGRDILTALIYRTLPRAFIETRFSGEYTLKVFIGVPMARGESSGGEKYPGKKGWSKTDVIHRITVMPGWYRLPERMKAVEGRLILSAEHIGDGLYRVVTAVQSRGAVLRMEDGWVATCATVEPAFGKTMCAADRKRSLLLQSFMSRAV